MRELKFRHYISFTGEMLYSEKHFYFLEDYFSNRQYDSSDEMQFTGLKDKNGVDVFDGDIIKGKADLGGKLKRFIGAVNVDLPSVTVKGVKQYSWKTCQSIFDVRCFEVIGNIYENPELLESK